MPIPLVTRILVADDHALVRDGLRHVINAAPDLEVVAEAADGAEAVEHALSDDIDLAILDISMPRMTGLQAARELSHRRPELRLVVLSMYENEQFLFEALKAGASGYVLKSGADDDIVDACRAAMRGQSFLYPSAVHTLVCDFIERADERGQDFDVLTVAAFGSARSEPPCLTRWIPSRGILGSDGGTCGRSRRNPRARSPRLRFAHPLSSERNPALPDRLRHRRGARHDPRHLVGLGQFRVDHARDRPCLLLRLLADHQAGAARRRPVPTRAA